ncbi:STAS domain-containing protein [Sporosarcina obsidiansis]|uniref:STAS domain-containing protein n=1 Tax=Sporosarcina obsidiansis TaxID=2660748 RepID=UPI00129BCAC8|nr:STAS domain-containing protein [Sporosarcina obsidiansis]
MTNSPFNQKLAEQFLLEHKHAFEQELLKQAVNVKDKVKEILQIGNIDLINNAHKLVHFVIWKEEENLRLFAKKEGIAWATHSLTLDLKLEWVQAIRRTLWINIEFMIEQKTIENYDFFEIEKQVNNQIDQFLNVFFINYSTYKDTLLHEQRKLVENLSVPIIPITSTVSILPLIGTIDYFRSKVMEERVLMEISKQHIQTLIIDLSGIGEMDTVVVDEFLKMIEGAKLMGCHAVITGLKPDVVRNMIALGVVFDSQTKTWGTLQQALDLYFK